MKIANGGFIVLVLLASSRLAFAQDLSGEAMAVVTPEAASLAKGWAALANSDAATAAELAAQVLRLSPRNAAALELAIDADIARRGAMAGLDAYEQWLGSRTLDDAYVLRRVARAMLHETAANRQGAYRVEAMRHLAADGDLSAASELARLAAAGGEAEAIALASLGNDQGVSALVAGLKNMPGARTRIIQALGDSQNRLAIPPLTELLTDPNSQTRAAAAEALAKLGAVEAISKIRPLLSDPVTFPVQLEAAGALYRLNDMSGVSFLRRLEDDPNGAIRLMAAQQMSSTPTPAWLNLVRGLLRDPDPMVRLEAARLLAPYEPDAAKRAFDALLVDPSIAVREASGDVYVAKVSTDFASLRRRLRSPDLSSGVRAAARILELTR